MSLGRRARKQQAGRPRIEQEVEGLPINPHRDRHIVTRPLDRQGRRIGSIKLRAGDLEGRRRLKPPPVADLVLDEVFQVGNFIVKGLPFRVQRQTFLRRRDLDFAQMVPLGRIPNPQPGVGPLRVQDRRAG